MKVFHRAVAVAFAGLVLVFSPVVQAAIYKYVDKDGHVTYSNVPIKGAKKISLDPLNTVPSSHPKGGGGATTGGPSPSGFPSVDSGTQKKRDDTRRKILEDELASEKKQLDEARKALAEQEGVRLGGEKNYQKYLDRVQPYKDNVTLHEKNVEALQKELSNMK